MRKDLRGRIVGGSTDTNAGGDVNASQATVRVMHEKLAASFAARQANPRAGFPVVVALRAVMQPLAPGVVDEARLLLQYGDAPPPESLEGLARENGLVLGVDRIGALKRAQLPAVVPLKDGSSAVVLKREAGGRYLIRLASGQSQAPLAWFKRNGTDTLLTVTRAVAATAAAPKYSAFSNLVRLARMVLASDRRLLVQVLLAALVSNLLMLVLPLFITVVYDRVVPYGAYETLAALTIGVLVVFGIDIGLRMARVNLQEALGVGVSQALQQQFYRKLVRSPLSSNKAGASGVSAVLTEMDGAALAMPSLLVSLAADLPFVIIMLAVVIHLGSSVVLAPLFGVALVAIITAVGSGKARASAGSAHHLKVKVQDQAAETVAMLATVKASRAEAQLIGRWQDATDSAAFAAHSSRQTSSWAGQISLVTTQMVIALTVVLGAIEITSGAITLGNLAACVMLVGRVIAPANSIVSNIGALINMRNAIGGFLSVIDRPEEVGGDEQALSGRKLEGRIDLHSVRFSYPGSPKASVDGVTLSIQPGERIGIIGRNGCGKSTLLKLLVRLYDPESGTMLFDGVNGVQLPPSQLRGQVSLMAQDTVLMNDTVRANITMGSDVVDPAAFDRAVALSGVLDWARHHPQGFSAQVGPRGENLSGGERQAVGLARAILNAPSVLLLDEPTSAMDSTAEGRLIQQLPAFLEGRTTIIATHRLQMLALVDRVIWMENGRIIADGPKASVLNSLGKAA